MTRILVVTAVVLLISSPALAQSVPPLPSGDAAAWGGWLAVEEAAAPGRGWGDSFFGGLSAGRYWTPHLKTELDLGAGTAARMYRIEPVLIDRVRTYQYSESTFSQRTLGVGQHYQFGRNAWFHPHVGAGVHLTWERRTTRYQPLVLYETGGPPGRVLREAHTIGPETTMTLRPYVAAGVKGYVTPRVFFRADARLAFRRGLEESQLRVGVGIDF